MSQAQAVGELHPGDFAWEVQTDRRDKLDCAEMGHSGFRTCDDTAGSRIANAPFGRREPILRGLRAMVRPCLWREAALLLLITLSPLLAAAQTLEFRNGQWFDGNKFVPKTAYAVDGMLSFTPPARIDRTVDLQGGYVVPPYAEAHTHSLSTPETLERHIQEYLKQGTFYALVQDAATELGPTTLTRVNRPDSVDVSYTQGVVAPSWSMIAEFYGQMGQEGHFGGKKQTLQQLDTRVVFLIDNREDLERKFDRLAALNPDFIKVILGFSEELEKRRNNPAYSTTPGEGTGKPGLDPKLLPLLVEKAHARGLRVSAHIETAADFEVAARAGVDMIAHLPGWQIGEVTGFHDGRLDHWKITEADARLAAEKKIAVITTAARDREDPRADEINAHNLRLLRRAGARIIFGTDGWEPLPILKEVKYVARIAEFDTLTTLRLLTEAGPQLVFPGRKIGALREGYEADFLVLGANPLDDPGNLEKIELRVKGGSLLPAPQVDSGSEPADAVTVTPVGGSVYLLDGAVDLIGVSVGEDGILMVDDGYMETLPAVRTHLESFGKGEPRIVINTHWHHGFANEGFGARSVLVAHRAVRDLLARENFMFDRTIPPKPPVALPIITFEDTITIHFNGEDIRLVYLPHAHTDGDIAVIFPKSNVVMTGDVFVPHVPWIDVPAGGSLSGLVAAIDNLLELVPPDARIIPGHGRVCSYADLQEFKQLLHDIIANIREQVAAGKSKEEVQARGLPARYADWEGPVPTAYFLGQIFDEIKAGRF